MPTQSTQEKTDSRSALTIQKARSTEPSKSSAQVLENNQNPSALTSQDSALTQNSGNGQPVSFKNTTDPGFNKATHHNAIKTITVETQHERNRASDLSQEEGT